jgi:hypothetical protein
MPWREHRLLNGFLDSDVGILQLKIVSIQVIHAQVAVCKIISED